MDRNEGVIATKEYSPWSLSARRAWIEIITAAANTWKMWRSLSARRAWIEIAVVTLTPTAIIVALRKESVDRNLTAPVVLVYTGVVALRKESVDRNCSCGGRVTPRLRSLSARRAWIEIR